MDLSPTLNFGPEPSLLNRKSSFPIKYPKKQHIPIFLQPNLDPKPHFPIPKTQFRIKARRWLSMAGLSQEMNAIASQNLDHAPARRRARTTFIDVHQQLDHCLFKMDHAGIRRGVVRKKFKGYGNFLQKLVAKTR